jgi:hypothetical protein
MISDVEQEWHRQNLAVQRQARDAEILRYREWREHLEKKLRNQRAALEITAKKAAPPATVADSGPGWKVLAAPRVAHSILEERADAIWKFCWHEADWPTGLRIKWGALDDSLLGLLNVAEVCTARQRGRVLGAYLPKHRIILVSEENHRGRPVRDIAETVIHEFTHVNVRSTVHGPQFAAALKSALTYYDGTPTAPTFMGIASARPPWAGMRFGPAGFRPGVGLDPDLEYR